MSDPDAATISRKLDDIELKLKAEGLTSIEDTISSLRESRASLTQATEARDKFAEDLKEARKNLGTKGGELGFLKQEVERLKAELEAKASSTEPAPSPKATPSEPTKTVEVQLAEVEAALTDEEWQLADQMLELVEDDDTAKKLAEPSQERLEVLKGIKTDRAIKPRPKSLRPQKASTEPSPSGGKTLFEQLKERMSVTTVGPQGGVMRARPGTSGDTRQVHPIFAR